jgi:hypothetical protein
MAQFLAPVRRVVEQCQGGTGFVGNWICLQVPLQRRLGSAAGPLAARTVHRYLDRHRARHCLFPHDSKTERIGVFRFSVGMLFFTLGLYLIPGLWGAPVKLISGFPPPMFYSEWGGGGHGEGGETSGHIEAQFTDYEQGLAAAQATGKPVLLDFTGWACVNCRKMEEQVWPDAEVSRIIRDEVILVSLYVDERKELTGGSIQHEFPAFLCDGRPQR